MARRRLFRTLEYSARVLRLNAVNRRAIAQDLAAAPDRAWREAAMEYVIIIGLMDGQPWRKMIALALPGTGRA